MKVVINRCYGGFGISDAAFERYLDLKGIQFYRWKGVFGGTYARLPEEEYRRLEKICQERPIGPDRYKEINGVGLSQYDIERNDPILVQVVQELGKKSWGSHAELKIVEVPDDIGWEINDYDGLESIHEVHRSWS